MTIEFETGQLIDGRYNIIKKLDEGGMGAVWKAADSRTNDSVVVLKFPLKYNDPEILERFATEAGTMRALADDCDNILDIQDIGSVAVSDIDNIPYYVMRFQTGGALRDWKPPTDASGQPAFTAESLDWVRGVATALDFLHHQETPFYHRDVKPENILFNASGTPKLSDFGIVKSIKKATTTITKTGAAMGTVAYMPPEIWRGSDFTPASDQFSFASSVYEVIAGQRPYDGETPFAMLESLAKGHVKLAQSIGLPTAASAALDQALEHEPEKRFETYASFATAFLNGLSNTDASKTKPSESPTGIHVNGISAGSLLVSEQVVVEQSSASTGGSLKLVAIGGVAVLAMLSLIGGLFMSGAFSGTDSENQPTAVRPSSSSGTSLTGSVKELSLEEYKESSLSLVEQHAELGFASAETELGDRACKSDDFTTAVKWFRKAAEQGYARAQRKLGFRYANGQGVDKDDAESVKWFREAAKQDDAKAQHNLGVAHAKGRGVGKDDTEAVKWYRKAAEQDIAQAQYNLGFMYERGRGVVKDDAEAVKWYRKAAEQDIAEAQNTLGEMYDEGKGVAEDDKEAVKWYRKAAEQGHERAQNELGFRYETGRGVGKDNTEAAKWYRKAAEHGYARAQNNLGLCYEYGRRSGEVVSQSGRARL